MDIQQVFSLIQIFIVLIIVIVLAQLSLKYLNNYSSKNCKNIKILERIAVNKNSYLGIVKILDEYYLMSFSEGKNEILKSLDRENAEEYISENQNIENDFKGMGEFFKEFVEKRKKID